MATITQKLDKLNTQLAAIEGLGINPINKNEKLRVDLGAGKGEPVEKTYQEWLVEIETIESEARRNIPTDKTDKAVFNSDMFKLARQKMALQYSANIGLKNPTEITEKEKDQFKQILVTYKADKGIYPGGDGQLTKNDNIVIGATCEKYPEFVRMLIARNT